MPPFNLGFSSSNRFSGSGSSSQKKSKADIEKDAIYERAIEMNRENARRKQLLKMMEIKRQIEYARSQGNDAEADRLERQYNTQRRG